MAPLAQVDFSPTRVLEAIKQQKGNKGVGRDLIPIEIFKAGGDVMAIQLSRLGRRIRAQQKWPLLWTAPIKA